MALGRSAETMVEYAAPAINVLLIILVQEKYFQMKKLHVNNVLEHLKVLLQHKYYVLMGLGPQRGFKKIA